MHAVKDTKYKIYFGGSYRERWSPDSTLTIEYFKRRWVEAVYQDGRWQAVGGDRELCALLSSPDCPGFTRLYFEAAATAYGAAHECLVRKLPLDRMGEFCHCSGNALVAPELMRLLMDDCGFSLERAYQVAAHCCEDIRASGVEIDKVYTVQPRTAHIVSLIRSCALNMLSVSYNGLLSRCRRPYGPLCCGDEVYLGFDLMGGRVESAELVIYGDGLRESYSMTKQGKGYGVTVRMPDTPRALWYFFLIRSSNGTHWLCPDDSGYIGRLYGYERGGFRLTVAMADFDTPAWFRRCVMYQIFPDRFARSDDDTAQKGVEYHCALGQQAELHATMDEPVRWQPRPFEKDYIPDDFYGGTLKGIEQRLPYLKELGIGCIYLNPIVEARSNHRYDASDYSRPDPILGTMADFESLCAAAKEQGMGVILDGVFSHTGADSIYFNRYGSYDSLGACQSKESPYYNWYDFQDYPDKYRCWWGFTELPEVDENNPDWQDHIVSGENSVVKSWLRHGASGWRLDVADELPDNVLALIRKAARETDPDALILGEVWEDAVIKESYGGRRNYALGYSLDSVMNYPLRNALLSFARGFSNAYDLRDFLISQQMNYPRPMYYSLMNLLGSHDVDRIATALAVGFDIRSLNRDSQVALKFSDAALERAVRMEKLCAAVQFTIPGVPSIYYGDEQGMRGVCDPFNRLPFREDNKELHDYYVSLSAQRNSAHALSTGEAVFMAANSEVLMILRYVKDGRDALGVSADNGVYLAVVNRSYEQQCYQADCSAAGLGIYEGSIAPCSAEIIKLG